VDASAAATTPATDTSTAPDLERLARDDTQRQ
jgi:hypothetical protein